ncbi:hypothetical protein F6X40_10350 [Paraburkholderia sp. UCT31]|uniref:hypothetical protein n=1 Tax=Paraburkholderia sp. UCT31 TaxID=2615209 RepID=UPI001656479A|nr:hypothetical protein [Paraburkholderia sp. UCT31]MBC8737208.1 hypothetical protein [Paraburkholderia sp. UCT31]
MVKIDDADALDRIAAIEGQAWLDLQHRSKENPYGFFHFLAAWKAKLEGELAHDPEISWKEYLEGGDGAIYGAGGYHRYVVSDAGVIGFSSFHAREENRAKALAEGFDLV